MSERKPETAPLKSARLARAMRRGFAESNWRMAITPSSNASSKTVNDLAGHAGRLLKITECDAPRETSGGHGAHSASN
jgi:hypothetical protein